MSDRRCFLSIVFMSLLLVSGKLLALTLNGQVYLEDQKQESAYKIVVNDEVKLSGTDRHFSIKPTVAKLYHVRIDADGYYPSYQTFSHYELENLDPRHTENNFTLPAISLVKRKDNRVMFAYGGDVMMARRYSKPYFGDPVLITKESADEDTKNLLRHVKPYMEIADFAAINLESQIVEQKPQERAPKSVTFYSPPEILTALSWAGVDYVTLGNNHIYDYLDEGLISTLEFMDKSQLAYSGAGLNQQQALEPHYEILSGNNYAMLGFVGWKGGFSPHQAAGPSKGGAALGTEENIISSVSTASEKGHPVIIQYHGGLEYADEPARMTESRLKTAIDFGADLVIAHHPHVTQGFEIYKGKLIAYSMGNFLFDQYYYATPLTYILYVWMDGDQFHRAEIVPVYLKGYVPVPATGLQRNMLTKRTETLSHKRGVSFDRSGGHLIISSDTKQIQEHEYTMLFNADETVKDLYRFPVSGMISGVESDQDKINYRLGENLLNGGDFEIFELFSSRERGWLLDGAGITADVAFRGQNSLDVSLKPGQSSVVGMQAFKRVFRYANPMTYQAKILNTGAPVKAQLYIQYRGNNDKFFAALKDGKKVLLDETIVSPNNSWQNYQVDFNTPRVGYRAYRLLLELTAQTDQEPVAGQVHLDDISLIQWQAHYNPAGQLPLEPSMPGLATHIGLKTARDYQQKLIISH